MDSLPGQVAFAQHYLRDGAHAPHLRHVRAKPVLSLHPRTSHDARARHLRLSQAAVSSNTQLAARTHHAAHLQRLEAAVRRPLASMEAAMRHSSVV